MNPHHFIFPNCETENALDMHPFHGMSDCIPHHTDDHMMLMQPSSSSSHHHHSHHPHHNHHHSSHYLSSPPHHHHHHHHHHTENNVMMDDEDSFIHHSHHHNSHHHPHSSQQSSHHVSHLPSLSNTMGMMIPHDDMNDIHQPSSYSVMQEYGEHLMSPPPMHNNNNNNNRRRRNQSSEEAEDSHHTLAEQATTADNEEDDAEVDEEDDNNALDDDEDDNKKNKKKKKKKKDCVDEHDIDTFSCGQCNRVYQYLSSLKSHCKSVHKSDAGWKGQYSNVISKKFAKNRDFACPMCDSSCASHYGLRRHMTTKHRESQKKLLLFYLIEDLCLKENSKHRDLILSNDKDYVMELKRRHLDELEQELECISPGSALTTPLTANSTTLSSMYPPPQSSLSTPNQPSDDDDEEEDDVRTPVTPFASLSVSTPTTTANTPTTPMTPNGQPKQKHTRGQGKWTETEKRNFLEGVKIYGKNNLHMIARFIKTKDAKQVEKFSNKYFSKLREGFQSLLGSYYSCVLTNNTSTANVVAAAATMTMVAATAAVTATTSSPHHTTTSVHTGSINHHLPTIGGGGGGGGGGSLGNLTIIPPSRSSAAPAILLSNPPSGHTPSSSHPSPSTNIFLQSTTVPSASSSSTAAVNTNAFYHSSMSTHHMQPTSPYHHHHHHHHQHHTHAFSSLTAPSLNSGNSNSNSSNSNSSDEERVSDSSVEQSPLTKRKRALSSTSDSTFPSNGGNSGLSASGNRLERKKMKSESPVHHSCITDMLMEGPDHLGSESSTNAYLLDSTSANIYSHHMSFGAMPTSTGVDSSGDVTDAAHVHSTNVSSTSPSSLHDHSTSNHNSHDALGSLAQSIHSDGHHSDDHSLLSHQQHLNANASLPMDEMLQSRLQALHQQKQQANQEEEYDIKPEEVELFNNMLFDDSLHNGYSYCQFIENETH